ncbi:Bax inhibitor-1/YccA family protein [Candidatus Babeliales bacterium]|nr:Bax inhibitor-1/YccA family protein [Candidatus Babeliales bacterium]
MFNNQSQYGSMAQGFMSKVYGWMCVGLATTASVMFYLAPEMNPAIVHKVTSNWLLLIGLFIVQFGILMYMMSSYARLSYATMGAMFVAFCALQGITLAPILYVYTTASVFYVFAIAAAMFATMAVYGTVTNADLSSMGNILFMGLVGLMIANLINMFMHSAGFDMVIASFGVGIFAMLTAYDVQNLKRYSQMVLSSPEESGKFALIGAISLYLNLINIFLYLLRLFGDKRRD